MTACRFAAAFIVLFAVILSENIALAQVLTPPYFNLAVGRRIEATSTCGQDVSDREWFCKLTGANPNKDDIAGFEVIQGQLCDYCDPSNATKSHPAENAIDGTEKWWQSPPLSRGLNFNEVNLTINFDQEFHVAYVFLKMGNAPRPGVFVLERSTDYGQTWKPWQFFADTESDCNNIFGEDNYTESITSDDSVLCATQYSKVVPLEGGEIVVSLVNNRPSANNFSYSQSLQEWTRATNVRLRLLRTKTLLGHLMALAQQDPTVTRRYYYSVKDISIGGRCVCNGHADICDKTNPQDHFKLICRCHHNTCGDQCEICCPGFIQKPWKPATLESLNECEQCNCHGHSTECYYDEEVAANGESLDIHGRYEGGGVCTNCQHNTEGINCDKCSKGNYRPAGVPLDSVDVCQPCRCDLRFSTGDCEDGTGRCKCRGEFAGDSCDQCNMGFYGWPYCEPCDCNINGTEGQVCEVGGEQCPCKVNYDGRNCDQCAYGFYGFPDCQPCACDNTGSVDTYCDPYSGECRCRNNYGGRDCGECLPGFYDYPNCDLCNCDQTGTEEQICDLDNGHCLCKENFEGNHCDMCARGYFRYPECIECGCMEPGFQENACDAEGQCVCNYNYAGLTCDRCAPGYYNYPECTACHCDQYGSYGITCDQQTGQCDCRRTFEGLTCSKCGENFYNYPVCEECNCNPAGAREVPGYPLGGCGAVDGRLCECKERVTGRICDTCKNGYWNLNLNNLQGCEECLCYHPGTTGWSSFCDINDGQCTCKPYVGTRSCDTCVDGTYNLQEGNIFGCEDCKCDIGGSLDHICNKNTGQCNCRPRVNGRMCNSPLQTHYFPTLYQHLYEMESGSTSSGRAVRYGFDQGVFPGYSWRGYAILSRIQSQVQVEVDIEKPSLYRLIFRYVNPSADSITADIQVTPEAATDVQQTSTVLFSPSRDPAHVTVSGSGVISTFVLNPGRWTISLDSPDTLYVDYLVLLPQAYYEATILQQNINTPCRVPLDDALCKHYVYVDVSSYSVARGESGYVREGDDRHRTDIFPDEDISQELGTSNMAHLSPSQRSMLINLPVSAPGKYVIVFQYHSTAGQVQTFDVEVAAPGSSTNGVVSLPSCPYSSLCRQPVNDLDNKLAVFDIDGAYASLTFNGRDSIDVAIDSIIAVPLEEWSIEFVQPKLKCIKKNKECLEYSFFNPTGSVKAEFEFGPNEDRVATDVPPNIIDTTVKVIKLDSSAPTVDVKTSVLNPAQYVLVAHYYQPNSSGFDVDVSVLLTGQKLEEPISRAGTFHAGYCPGVSGCRSVIMFEDGMDDHLLDLRELDLVVFFNNTAAWPVWLDYIMVIPAPQFQSTVVDVQPVDKSVDFINKCGENDFLVDPSSSIFCRNAVFSLTTEYNNGALSCGCNNDGSLSFSCEEFGGQCHCRANVIGRTCSQCRTGFYGFPNCRTCDCPSGLCDPDSGACVCPARVTGEDCNTCLPMTFGFDPLIGCEDCFCDPEGVSNNDMDCDVDNGQCSCKPNIAGRRCDRCVAGYYGFPRCLQCNCDTRGTVPDICDQRSSECLCKQNVEGPQCTSCMQSSFYLEDRNPKGCTTCFCFGTTTSCQMSNYRRTQVIDMQGWGITNLNSPVINKTDMTISSMVKHNDTMVPSQAIYWVAPESYLQNKVTAYGGKLIYRVDFQLHSNSDAVGIVQPDIRIEGNNLTLVHISSEQPSPGVQLTVEVDMLENKFIHESTGAYVTREQFMTVLSRIEALQIRASYYDKVSMISLTDVQLDTAAPDGNGAMARNVEQCQCPPNYIGSSCEQCAPGYYRARTGPYLGVCVACECNNKADTCDPDTGVCLNCRDNFGGAQCLSCRPGHYYDQYSQTCLMCACPLQSASNNFAETCQVYVSRDSEVTQCQCLPGYRGQTCEICDIGYYGNPTEVGNTCQPCMCSGNIDLQDPLSCDMSIGDCLRCINNAAGDNCERCKEWYWGDAIDGKDCRQCTCDPGGTVMCDHRSGDCLCKPNVVGENCDMCAPESFGYGAEGGCEACDCAMASYGAQCNITTGQCECRPGVTGRRCDQCERDYWNYGPRGCQKCACEFEGAMTCDSETGRCVCLPGVTGPTCDQCLPRWAFIPEEGCIECDNCIHLLLDDTESLIGNVTYMKEDLESVSVGVGAIRHLEAINKTVQEYRPQVDSLIVNPDDDTILDPIKQELPELVDMAGQLHRRADSQAREADLVEMDAADLRDEAEGLDAIVKMAADDAKESVSAAKKVLEDITNSAEDSNVDQYLAEAEKILEEIIGRDFTIAVNATDDELLLAEDALERARELYDRAMEQVNRSMEVKVQLDSLDEKLLDLMNSSRFSLDNSKLGQEMNSQHLRMLQMLKDLLDQLREKESDAAMMVDMALDFLDNATLWLDDAKVAYTGVEANLSRLDQAIDDMKAHTEVVSKENLNLRPLVDNATRHAFTLHRQAAMLESLIRDTQDSAEAAVNASKSYKAIVDAINTALNASGEAIRAAVEARTLSSGLAEKAKASLEVSTLLKSQANLTYDKIFNELLPDLEIAKEDTDRVAVLNSDIGDELAAILLMLDMLPEKGYSVEAQAAADSAMNAEARAKSAQEKVERIVERLPEDEQKVEQISLDVITVNSDIKRAQTQAEKVVELVPDVVQIMDDLGRRVGKIDQINLVLANNITALRDLITQARGQARHIDLGMTFDPSVSLSIRNPKDIADVASKNTISLYFKTNDPNGFLAYVGPEKNSNEDYLSLELIGGHVVFKFDLGSGPSILHSHNAAYNDGAWHQVNAERIGKNAKLTVRTDQTADDVVEGQSEGTYMLLDLTATSTRFYVGGVPNMAELEDQLTFRHFNGCMEHVKFGDSRIGLWDFVEGENNINACESRGQVLVQPTLEDMTFSGEGYVILEKKLYNPRRSSKIGLSFKTFNPEGLIFLWPGHNGDFMSVEMRGGKVIFKFDLGTGNAEMTSQGVYNDGKWHQVWANRVGSQSLLKLVDEKVGGNSPGQSKDFDLGKGDEDQNIYIGGYKGTHMFAHADVTQVPFTGCLKGVQFGTSERSLNDNIGFKLVQEGCQDAVRIINFAGDISDSYIAMEPVGVNENYEMTFKVKTTEKDGLLFYTADDSAQQENAFSVSLVDGLIKVIGVPGGTRQVLESSESQGQLNDGRWHYVTVIKQGRDIMLGVDDKDPVQLTYETTITSLIQTTTPLYFGGVPPGYNVVQENVGTKTHLIGCIGDVTVNGRPLNFASAPPSDQQGTSLADCPIPDPEPSSAPQEVIKGSPSITPPVDGVKGAKRCALPLRPEEGEDTQSTEGVRFGSQPYSRYEYDTLPETASIKANFSLEFKTTSADGVLFYIANERQVDFVALYLSGGRVNFNFNCGSGIARMISENDYSDGQWHTVEFSREKKRGKLIIDNGVLETAVTGRSSGSSRTIDVSPPYFVGGLNEEVALALEGSVNTEGMVKGFTGCVRNLLLNSNLLGEPSDQYYTQPCSASSEVGSFFYAEGGYLILEENYKVGLDLVIELDVKPRSLSGVLLSVHSVRGDYLVLQMVGGDIVFSVVNGDKEIQTIYKAASKYELCNGQWYNIKATKAKNVVILTVNSVFRTYPGIGLAGFSSTDTNDPLYIGGVPDFHPGIKTREQFVGCIRNLKMADVVQNLSGAQSFGRVGLSSCPAN